MNVPGEGHWSGDGNAETMTCITTTRPRNPAGLSTEEMREWIELLYKEQNFTDQQIAAELGVNRTLITRLRNEMNLVAKRGKDFPGFSPEHDEKILLLRDERGWTWAAITREIGRRDPREVSLRYDQIKIKHDRVAAQEPVKPKKKNCLKCRSPFETCDPKKEWVCEGCRESNLTYGPSWDGDYDVAV